MASIQVNVYGVVQGVGFRPFVYNRAVENRINGYVLNKGTYVEILCQGKAGDVSRFIEDIRKGPKMAKVEAVDTSDSDTPPFDDFTIRESEAEGREGFIPPDIATCDDCIRDVISTSSRYSGYWATSCTNCGPRYTLIRSLPYDRENTEMSDFPPCDDCLNEYRDPDDRRFHAQTICCDACGPNISFMGEGKGDSPIEKTAEAIKDGRIVAIKGVGGFHITCTFERIPFLRRRVGRLYKPFAAMATFNMIKEFAIVSEREEKLLKSGARPIVLLEKKNMKNEILEDLSPGMSSVGFMLPYTALHHLLFNYLDIPVVLTSANLPGEPILTEYKEVKGLGIRNILDHDRPLRNRCDDSVVRVTDGKKAVVRFSRGYGPSYFTVDADCDANILGVGAEKYSSIALYTKGQCYLSHYLGRLDNLKSFKNFKEAIEWLLSITQTTPDVVVSDLHPLYLSTDYARELAERFDAELIGLQHHRAHLAHLNAEVGIALDGVGYGDDGTVWGGEVFVGEKRVGGLKQVDMPGGDLATRYPPRMVLGILGDVKVHMPEKEKELVLRQIERGVNCPKASSTGRVLDAMASILGVCHEATYEGQPAMMLEGFAAHGRTDLPFDIQIENNLLDTTSLVRQGYEMVGRYRREDIAASFTKALAEGMAMIAADLSGESVCLSGGVAYNSLIVKTIREYLEGQGIRLIASEQIPRGDGGISYGQAIHAAKKFSSL